MSKRNPLLVDLPRIVPIVYGNYGRRGIDDVFFRTMTQQDRDDFDVELVRARDPLAYEAGTQESRFRTWALRIVGIRG